MANAILTSGGLAMMRDYLASVDPSLAPSPPFYLAIGSGTVTVGRYMTQVPGETFRQPIVAVDKDGNGVVYHGYLGTTDNNGQTVGCYGVFGGAATLSANTGTLFAVANESSPFSKDPTLAYSVDLIVTVSGTVQ